jgi:hypothetical protein
MSWQTELTTIVRTLCNDWEVPYKYSDIRIQQTLVVAAQFVEFDINLPYKYIIDIQNVNMTPDPTTIIPSTGEKDTIFISLISLKAACIIDQSTYRTKAAMEGVRAAMGPASLTVSGNTLSWKTILDYGPCKLYEDLTEHWDVANATQVRAIFSPFVGNHFDPQNLRNPNFDYSRYQGNEYY